jgi:TolB-like protein/Tfp pilus assembly protein PilF/tRNA A-37 threonylcarbamoyl transferase component Bud32
MVGKTLGHYTILEQIGAGGMGEVYRAYDERLEREVAIKVLPAGALADPVERKRFRKEALALSKLNHPNIATVHEFAREEGIDCLVMEYITGVSLNERLGRGPLLERDVLPLAEQLAEGLAAAHDQGLVHRDLKPGNLRITPEGRLKILDFGLAQLAPAAPAVSNAATETRVDTQIISGTLPYMAPEQLRGEGVDHRSDIWAVGVVLYEMTTGRRPFDAKLPTAIAADIQTKPAARPGLLAPQLSHALEFVILKCLEKDPERRYQSARELLADLRRLYSISNTDPRESAGPAASAETQIGVWIRRATTRLGTPVVVLLGLVVAAAAIALVLIGKSRQEATTGGGRPSITSLAVLPLINLSRDPEQDPLVEAMHEALITELSKISALRVISRTSTIRYKGTDRSIPEIAEELHVDALVEGSVLRSGDRLRVSAKLMQSNPERQVWAQQFERNLTNVLYLTSDVAQAMTREIRTTLTPVERASLERARPVNPAAYELYTVGLHQWNQRTIDGHYRAIQSFQKAIAIDTGYAPAYAALADCYILLGEQGGMTQSEARSKARDAISKALQSEPPLPEAYTSLARWKLNYEWNWSEAAQAYRKAVELNPGYAPAHQLYGRMLSFAGRHDEALKELLRARELDPLSPTTHGYTAQAYLFARDYQRATEHIDRGLEMNPNHALLLHNLGELLIAQGRFDDAIEPLEQSVELSRERSAHYVAILGSAYARARRRTQAVEILNELTARETKGLVSAFDMAHVYLALGDKERALARLQQGYERKDVWLIELKAWPWFDSLASDPRFQAVVRGVGFPPA